MGILVSFGEYSWVAKTQSASAFRMSSEVAVSMHVQPSFKQASFRRAMNSRSAEYSRFGQEFSTAIRNSQFLVALLLPFLELFLDTVLRIQAYVDLLFAEHFQLYLRRMDTAYSKPPIV